MGLVKKSTDENNAKGTVFIKRLLHIWPKTFKANVLEALNTCSIQEQQQQKVHQTHQGI